MPRVGSWVDTYLSGRLCRKLVEAEQKYSGVMDSMQQAAAEYKEVLSQYDLEFEEKGQQMSDKLQKV